ncbi:MAG: putative photosynthetic complex assembly protein PuhE [Tagaea sp.]
METALAFLSPAGAVIAAWWIGTAAIMRLDRLPRRTFPVSLAAGGVLAILGLIAVIAFADQASATGAYVGFGGALLLWAWVELAFLTGAVVGPRRAPCPPGTGVARLFFAVQAVLYHELALLAVGAALLAATWGAANMTALWVFAVLWCMRASAKLNLHFGVPNLGDELLPEHLRYLGSYFSRGPATPLFPVTVGLAVLVAMPLWKSAYAHGAAGFEGTQMAIVATLLSLAIAEHLLMVLPIPQSLLWGSGEAARARGAGAQGPGEGTPS